MTLHMHVRHGTALISWNETKKAMEEPLLGVLEALGLNTKDILAAASDRFNGIIDLAELILTDPSIGGKLARVFYDRVFHSDKAIGGDADNEEDDWLDLGIDTAEAKAIALENLVATAAENAISADGEKKLRTLVCEYEDVFRVR